MYKNRSLDGWSEREGMVLADAKFVLDGLSRYTQLHYYSFHLPGPEGETQNSSSSSGQYTCQSQRAVKS